MVSGDLPAAGSARWLAARGLLPPVVMAVAIGACASGGEEADGRDAAVADDAAVDGGGGSGDGGQAPPHPCEDPGWDPADFATVYDVGPAHDLATPSDVPWESIGPGTLVRIHRRDTPYADKWVLAVEATAQEPVVVLGVPEDGRLPEITGRDAVTRQELNYWSQQRGVIKVGGSSVPAVPTAEHIVIECLDISGARAEHGFTDANGGAGVYSNNASAIFLESGNDITIRNNVIHDSGNGLFIAWETRDTLVAGNHLFDNGVVDSVYEHNAYTAGQGIVYEHNRFGPLCTGCPGNNLKDRSSELVVRYNWIDGGNRALDIVDSGHEAIRAAPDYHDTFVYGNVLIAPDGGNRQLVHYGGDNDADHFRTGTLHFFHNTVVSERSGLFSMVRLSSADAHCDARNNVIYAHGGGDDVAILEDAGSVSLRGSWLQAGYREGTPSQTGTVDAQDNVEGTEPGFEDVDAQVFHLVPSSPARGIAVPLAEATSGHPVQWQYAAPGVATPRTDTQAAGAFESP
jgi:hypothetical protein